MTSANTSAEARTEAHADTGITGHFDVVVIGAGPAGEVVAGRCADNGLQVAIVERELVGGECSYWGCMPSKVLLRPGDVVAAARRVPGAGAAVTGEIDTAEALAWRNKVVGNFDDTNSLPWLTDRGIEVVRGRGRLTGTCTVEVADGSGTTRSLTARRAVVLATGTAAALPPIAGLEDTKPWTNREITATGKVPRRLLVLGGGAIGLEMAQAFRRLGSRDVTVIEAASRILIREEPYVADEVQAALEDEGIRFLIGAKVVAARRRAGGTVVVTLEDGIECVGDVLLVAAGRKPNTEGLGLEAVGLQPGRSIEVDDQLRAKVEGGWLYAVGDCNGRSLLTHMGKYQARVAADTILGRSAAAGSDHTAISRVTFTDPQVCAVGLTEEQAVAAGIKVAVVSYGTGDVAGGAVLGDGFVGTSKLVIDTSGEGGGVVVGATFVGPGVQELLHSATVAIVGKVPLQQLWHAVPSFPTLSEVWLRLLEEYGL